MRTEESLSTPQAETERVGRVGSTVAGRYHLLSILGTGGQGEVFTAQDQLSGELVALKWMNSAAARARREVSALRLLRLPGVVRFLDEGVDEGRPFLVMEQVSGTPFPGRAVPCTWDDISGVVLGWLETLARIHSAGVVHRDLKPANVLVDVSGRATVLDFGLSLHEAPSSSPLTQEREMLGTPAYLAPEQINGESATQRTDLYAVGVMLYEALSGHIPHEARDLRALLRARLLRRPAPLRSVAPEVPPGIAEVVARLLSVDAGERPVSATEVIGLLRGQPLVSRPSAWLGARAPVDALVAAARAGVSLHLSGGEGSGRSRCLREASEELAREGRRVEWIRPGKRALSAFAPWVEAFVQENPGADLARVEGELVAMLRAKLSAGVVLVVDDHHTLDRASARMVARCAAEGSWLTAGVGPGLALAPLSADDLGALFVGPDRLLHLREDGARLLWERTEGVPARVFAELEAWERSGLAHRDGERWSVRRGELERIELGPALRVEEAAPLLPVHSQELLAWIELSAPYATASQLSRAMEQPLWQIEAEARELLAQGLVYHTPQGGLGLRVARDLAWTPEQRQAAHRAIARALPAGSLGRLRALVLGIDEAQETHAEIVQETALIADQFLREGKLGQASQTLSDGVYALREVIADWSQLDLLFARWAEVALWQGTPQAIDKVLYELCRSERSGEMARVETLLRAALAAGVWSLRALALVENIAPFADTRLERRRQGVRVLAARRGTLSQEETILADIARWAEAGQEAEKRLYAAWLGRLRYRQGRFAEAVALQAQAVESESLFERLSAWLNGASALLEEHRCTESAAWARSALLLARTCRLAYFEGRAEWLLRAAAYRRGETLAPDLALVEAASAVPVPEVEGLIGMTEAAIAWRSGQTELARDLSRRTREFLTARGEPLISLLVAALEVACGAPCSVEDAEKLSQRAAQNAPPEVALQVLGLLALGGRRSDAARVASLLSAVPAGARGLCMEVMSIDEALAALA